jgi:hypothetical protein
MIDIQAVQGRTIALGRLGENNYTRILFDVSGWLADYPSASIGLLNVRPGQTTAYPVSPENLSLSDGVLYWTVTNSDLSAKGTGRCELVAYQGNTIMKSAIYKTMCLEALDGGATPPEPWESWQSFFQALADNAAQSASDAEAAAEHYPRIVDGVWEVWDAQAGVYVSTGVQALGVDGVSPTITVAPITGGHRITITDANGTHTVDVLDGENGDAGRGIVSVQKTGTAGLVDTYTITYTDNTTSTFTVTNGKDGTDGVSPTITITDITGGHRVTITDADGQHSFDVMDGVDGQGAVQDVQVNGTSVLDAQGVANVPLAVNRGTTGVVKINQSFGITETLGILTLYETTVADVKSGAATLRAVLPKVQHASAFYGLAKAAGDTTQSASSNAVGNYTDAAKSAISTMLNGQVTVSGTTPSITVLPGIQYVCGEVATLDITLPASGCIDVIFQSGSTPTVLTVTPPSGQTVKWANGFDPTSLDANTTYAINIKDGLGVAASWT